jgi:hypothetical protein
VPGGLPTLRPFQEGTQDGVAGCIWLRGAIKSQRGSSLFVGEVVVVVVVVVLAVAVVVIVVVLMGDCGCLFRGQADVSLLTPVHKKNFLIGVVATLQLVVDVVQVVQTVLTVVVVCGC